MIEVPFEGPEDALIYIVGEAPGEQETIEGRPFVGGSGRILNRLLQDVGISRSQCRLGNVVRIRPPGNKFEALSNDVVQEGVSFLLEDIRKTKPNIVIALGNHPMEALLGYKGVSNWRGSVVWSEKVGCKVIPTYHPAFIMRQWEGMPLARFDLLKAQRESLSPILTRKKRHVLINPTFQQALLRIALLHDEEMFSFDIETSRGFAGIPPIISAIGFAWSDTEAISIPFYNGATSVWSVSEEAELLLAIKRLLEDKKPKKIAQNAQFDMGVLEYVYGIRVSNLYLDTMCAFHCLYSELPKGLDTISSIYTDQPYYKDWVGQGFNRFQEYNGLDALVTFESATEMVTELKEFGVYDFYMRLINPLIHTLLRMQLTGIRIDESLKEKASFITEIKLLEAQQALDKEVGYQINAKSPKQLKDLLYERMKLPPKYKKSIGKGELSLSTDEETLASLNEKFPSPIFDLILEVRGQQKLLGTYLETPLQKGRMHTSFNIGGRILENGKVRSGPATGRLSSSESIVCMSGTNLQNIPSGICRKMFIPDAGKEWGKVDLSQAEARVVAIISDSAPMLEIFAKGLDIHKFCASIIFGVPYDEVTPEQRRFAKTHVHAFNYGESSFAFAMRAKISRAEADLKRDRYLTATGIRRWHYECQNTLSKSRIVKTPMGRKRIFFGRWGDDLIRQRIAFEPQSVVADVVNEAITRFQTLIDESGLDVQILLQVHDEIDWQSKPEDRPKVLELLKKAFDIRIQSGRHTLVIPHEVKWGPNWNDVKEIKDV